MNATTTCPGPVGLQEYLLGRMSEATAASTEAHLMSCPECRKLLPTIRAEDDFVADFRAQAGRPQPRNPLLDRLAGDLRGLLGGLPTGHDATPPADAEATPAPVGPVTDADDDVRSLLAPPQRPDELGRLGDYRVLKVLGSGGMGVVFLAEDTRLLRRVALKAMKPALAANARSRQRFLREAQLTASLTHDHVVVVHQVGEEKGVPFLAMPLLQGESLEARLKREGRLPLLEVLRIGRETAEGLAAAHEHGLIHRDVKPANLWLEAQPGGRTRVKVLDFGLARAADGDVHLTQTGAVVGTPAYMAPEQARGEKVDARGDLFSLGCVLYKLCTGTTPFAGESAMAILMALAMAHPKPPRELAPDAPAELSDLVMRLLDKEPARRPASAGEVAHALEVIERRLTRKAPADATVALAAGPVAAVAPRTRRLALIVAAAVLLAGLIGVGAAALIRVSTDQGDYVIEADDADFSFAVHDGAVRLEDHKTDKKYTLKVVRQDKDAKDVEMEVNDGGDLSFKTKTFTIKRGEKAAVTAWFERKPAVADAQPPPTVDDAWVKQVAALPPPKQVEALAAKLKELNPGFDGKVTPTFRPDGVLDGLNIVTDNVTDISPVRALAELKSLECRGSGPRTGRLSDLSPLKGMSLTYLHCGDTQVEDLSPLKGMKLMTCFACSRSRVVDLAPLNGLPLTVLYCDYTKVSDLSPLKGMKLTFLACTSTRVSDLSPLTEARLDSLNCAATTISDLSPLKGMPLRTLYCYDTKVHDLSPLKGMPLVTLVCADTRVSDLSPLKEAKLKVLSCDSTKITDLSPLAGMGLEQLSCGATGISDLEPLKGMPLTRLQCEGTKVSELVPLRGMQLTTLVCGFTQVSDLSVLKGMPLTAFACDGTKVSDLSPLKGMPLTDLWCDGTKVSDLSLLKGMPLKVLRCDFVPERDTEILHSIPTLETINKQPAKQLLKQAEEKRPDKGP